jgi:hypothetical protein
LSLAACAAAPSTSAPAPEADLATWRSLATLRPVPLEGAPRIALADVQLVGSAGWPTPAGVTPTLLLSELVTTGLLPRADVTVVERRRFSAAAEAERRGARAPGAPPAGVSAPPDFFLYVVWVPSSGGEGHVEMRLTVPSTGAVRDGWRVAVSRDRGVVGLSRAIVSELLTRLASSESIDPTETRSPPPAAALEHFARGLAEEERWRWEEARIGYQAALVADPDFSEARAALERTARLRLGGTLAGSD